MDLRDYFAGVAMQGLLAREYPQSKTDKGIATQAYAIADAMIAERYECAPPKYVSPAITVTMVDPIGRVNASDEGILVPTIKGRQNG
jgi:hypothetical protein